MSKVFQFVAAGAEPFEVSGSHWDGNTEGAAQRKKKAKHKNHTAVSSSGFAIVEVCRDSSATCRTNGIRSLIYCIAIFPISSIRTALFSFEMMPNILFPYSHNNVFFTLLSR